MKSSIVQRSIILLRLKPMALPLTWRELTRLVSLGIILGLLLTHISGAKIRRAHSPITAQVPGTMSQV